MDIEPTPQHYFSPSTRGFYVEGVTPVIPPDAVEISPEEYAALLNGQTDGGTIVLDSGRPAIAYPTAAARKAARIEADIAALEATVTPRMLQEAVTGSTAAGLGPDGALTAAEYIASVRTQVAALRAKRKPSA